MVARPLPLVRCPSCAQPNSRSSDRCGHCGLRLVGPAADEIGYIDNELTGLDHQLRRLHDDRERFAYRRRTLVEQLRVETAAFVRTLQPVPAAVTAPPPPKPSPTHAKPRTVDENPPWTVQNILLGLGGLLLSVAAIVFTVVAWGRVGIGGRAAMLAALTIVVLAVPVLLDRRGLRGTAVAIASVGLVFLGLDAYAARASGLVSADAMAGTTYAGVSLGVVAAIAACYPALVRNRFMRPVAIVLAQAVLPLLVVELNPGVTGWAGTALVIAAADMALAWWRKDTRELMIVASSCAAVAVVIATGSSLVGLLVAGTALESAQAAGVLVMTALVLMAGGLGLGQKSVVNVGACSATVAIALGLIAVPARLGTHPPVVALIAIAGCVAALAAVALPVRWRSASMLGALLVVLGGSLPIGLSSLMVMASDGAGAIAAWSGQSGLVRAAHYSAGLFGGVGFWTVIAAVLTTMAATALAWRAFNGWIAASTGIVGLSVVTLLVPNGLALAWPVALPIQLAVIGALAAAALARRTTNVFVAMSVICALALSMNVVCWSAQWQHAAIAALSALASGAALAAVPAHNRDLSWLPIGLAVAATAADSLEILSGLPVWWMSFGPLAVAAVAVGIAVALPSRQRVAAEFSALLWALVAAGLTVGHPWQSGLVFASIGAIAAAAAFQRDRRFLGYVAAAALVVASWCWLGAAAVHVPEAYTLPGAVALLAFRLAWAVRRPPSPWQTAQVAIAWIFVVVPSLLWLPMAPDEAWIRLTALVVVALLTAVASSAIRLPWPVPGFAASGWQLIGELAAAFAVLAATLDAVAVGFHLRLEAPAIAYSALAVGAIAVGISALLRPIRPRQALLVEVAALPAALVALGFTAGAPFHTGLVFFLMGLVIGLTALRPDRRQAGFVAVGLELLATWSWLAAAHIGTPEAYTLPAAALAIAAGFWMSRRWPQLLSWATLAPGAAGLLLPSLAMTFVAPDESWRPFALGFVALAVTIASVYRRRQAPFLISATVLAILAVHELSPFVAEVVTALPRWVPLAVGGVILLVVGARYEHRRQDVVRLGKAVARMR